MSFPLINSYFGLGHHSLNVGEIRHGVSNVERDFGRVIAFV